MATFPLFIAHANLERNQAQQLAQFARETGHALPDRTREKLPGDPLALRGIPVVGYGVPGVSPGTRPDTSGLFR